MTEFLQTAISSLAIGSLYALIALGYTMVYGILKFINFAHSDIFVLGVWLSYTFAVMLGAAASGAEPSLLIAIVVLLGAMLSCGIAGFTIERLAYRPLRNAPRLNVLITAIGVSLFLQNFGQLQWVFGTQPKRMPNLIPDTVLAEFMGVKLLLVDALAFGTALALMLGLERLVFHSKMGRAMRAVSFNLSNAALMGINVDRVVSFTFVLGSSLAAAAGLLYALKYPGLNQPAYTTWVLLGLKAFIAAVVGGIGNVRGAMLGGFMIGLLEQFGAKYVSVELRDLYVFALLIVVLLVKPSGILGSTAVEKV